MKTLIVWYFVTLGYGGVLGFSPTFPSQQACEQFKAAVQAAGGKCVQTTIVDQGK